MANILSYIELHNNEATAASLCALNRGRDVASKLGATLYALLPCGATPTYDDEDIIAVLSRHGADKVILLSHPRLAPPALYATHGEAILAACRQFPPRLVLFPASTEARDMAPRLAVALRAHYVPDATLLRIGERYVATRRVFRRRYELRQPLHAVEDPVVVTLRQERDPEILGDDEAEVIVVHAAVEATPPVRLRTDPVALPRPRGPTVGGGAGLVGDGDFQVLERVARALNGTAAATGSACRAGLATTEWQVGLDGGAVESELYLALGLSGSERHLAGVAPHTEIIAVNSDPMSEVFKVARRGLIADASDVLHHLSQHLGQEGGRSKKMKSGGAGGSSPK